MTATVTAYNDDDWTLHHRFFNYSNSTVYNGCSAYIHDEGDVPGRCPEWLICSYSGCPGPTTFFPPYDVLRLITLPPSIKDSEYNFATHNI